jgi:hypothetical protein
MLFAQEVWGRGDLKFFNHLILTATSPIRTSQLKPTAALHPVRNN